MELLTTNRITITGRASFGPFISSPFGVVYGTQAAEKQLKGVNGYN